MRAALLLLVLTAPAFADEPAIEEPSPTPAAPK